MFCIAIDYGRDSYRYDGTGWVSISGRSYAQDAVSCPADGVCMAVSLAGYATRFTDGQWDRRVLIDRITGLPTDISCPTTSFCMLVDYSGMSVRFTGGRWRN